MIADLEAGSRDAVIVLNLDRLHRRPRDSARRRIGRSYRDDRGALDIGRHGGDRVASGAHVAEPVRL